MSFKSDSNVNVFLFQFKIDLNRTLPPLKNDDAQKIENLYKTVPAVKSRHPVMTPPKQRKINGMSILYVYHAILGNQKFRQSTGIDQHP